MLFLDDLSMNALPIELCQDSLLFKSNFDYINENEIKMVIIT
jgi:hypothetical protein